MNRAVIFDVNETMLDLGALDPLFARWFGDPIARKEWFAQTLHFAMTLAATREFRSFGEVGRPRLRRSLTAAAYHFRATPPRGCARPCCDCRLTSMWRPPCGSCATQVW